MPDEAGHKIFSTTAPSLDIPYIEENFINHGFTKMLVETLQIYCDQAAQSISNIQNALDASNIEEVGYLAHNLKGSSGSMGAAALAAISEQIETDVLNHHTDNLPALVSSLQNELGLTVTAIEEELKHLAKHVEPDFFD
jgi:HPt (histidine-containing phosphotransfer) domain-containing protein